MSTNYYNYEQFGEKSKFFFKDFPYIEYDILGNGEKQKIKNFFKRFDFRQKIKKVGSIYTKWVVRDEDSPQVIAHKLYESTHYYWIVLMINTMTDPNFSFPMTDRELFKYVERKYGIDKTYSTHHYESIDTGDIADLPSGIIVDKDYPHKKEINNIDFEILENDNRRKILILKPEYLEQVLEELETILQSGFTRVK